MTLQDEVQTDPLGLGYAGMTDQQVADSLNASTRSRNRSMMTASEVMNQINVSEFNILSSANERKIWDVLHIGDINPFGVEAAIFIGVFGGGSATVGALQAARIESVSRATELGLGKVKVGHIAIARS